MHCYYWLTDDKFNSNKAKKSTPNDQLVKLNQRIQWIFTYWAKVYRGVGYRLELDPCRANAVAKTTVLRGIGLLSLTQGLAKCIFILKDLFLNHVFESKNVQFQGQRICQPLTFWSWSIHILHSFFDETVSVRYHHFDASINMSSCKS